jgi:ATP-dependent Clp protease ATP-binding subunit ClpX
MPKPIFDHQNDWEEILKKETNETEAPNSERQGSKEGIKIHPEGEIVFNLKPEDLESYLNQYVVGQEEAIEVIATKVCTHFNRMKVEKTLSEEERIVGNIKSNMLMIGPTGVGKTYIVKLIAKKIGVPFVKADATKFSETGYVGGDVEDIIRELVHEADGDISKAEYGIVYLDEIDKIASSGHFNGPDVSRTGVQRNLLKLMEEAEVDLKTPHDLASQVEAAMEAQRTGKVSRKKINTKNILFIVSGAFSGLDKIIRKRLNMQVIGFDNSLEGRSILSDTEILKYSKTEDLIEFGFESEFIGRLPVIVNLNEVNEDVLYQILKNKHSAVVNGKKLDFRAYGIGLEFTDGALKKLAGRASKEKTGARGLLSVFEKTLIKFEKTLPSLEIKNLVIDEQVVDNPATMLEHMLTTDSIKSFQRDFFINHALLLEFTPEAIEAIQLKTKKEKKSFRRICEDLFHDYPYGIRLMKLEQFSISKEAVDDPTGYLDRLIREKISTQSKEEPPVI